MDVIAVERARPDPRAPVDSHSTRSDEITKPDQLPVGVEEEIMSHADATRVVHDNVPYLVVDDGRGEPTVFGPFEPGTEPSLAECTPDHRLTDPDTRKQVIALRPVSPDIPAHASSLAERE